jgi:serine/threonine protein phosphatase 1
VTPLDTLLAADGAAYFSDEAIQYALDDANYRSRRTVALISPQDFLTLAEPGHSEDKEAGVRDLLASGTRFDSLPVLTFQNNGDGTGTITGHEGRHRSRALIARGVKQMPVILNSGEQGHGPAIRWGSGLESVYPPRRGPPPMFPSVLISEKYGRHRRPTPISVVYPDASAEYAQAPSTESHEAIIDTRTAAGPRSILVGDVHGQTAELREMLTEKLVPPFSLQDRLILVGDLLSKDALTKGDLLGEITTVQWLRSLREAGYDVVFVKGNHELRFEQWLAGCEPEGGFDEKHKDEMRVISSYLSVEDKAFIQSSVFYYNIPEWNILVVHGGIPPKLNTLPEDPRAVDSLPDKDRKRIYQLMETRYVDRFTGRLLPKGGEKGNPNAIFWADSYDGRFGHVFFGHTQWKKLATPKEFPHATGLDLGAAGGNYLAAIVVEGGKQPYYVTVQSHQGRHVHEHLSVEALSVRSEALRVSGDLDCTDPYEYSYQTGEHEERDDRFDNMDLAIQLLSEQVIRLGPVLGCGFYACAYPLLDYPGYVLKVSGDPSDAAAWQNVIQKVKREKVWPAGVAYTPLVFAFPSSTARRPYFPVPAETQTSGSWGGLEVETGETEFLHAQAPSVQLPAPAGQFFGIVQEELSSLSGNDAEFLTAFGLRLRVRGDLSDALKGAAMPPRFKAFVQSLRWLDKHGILTRDIKGDNAMAGPDGEWKITDLGINCAPSVNVPDIEDLDLHALLGALPKRVSQLSEARRRFAEEHPGEAFEPLSLFGMACIAGDIIAPDPIPGLPGPITAAVLSMDRLPDSRPPTVGGLCDWPEGQQVGVVVRALDLAKGTAKIEYRGRDGAVLRRVPIVDLTNCRGPVRAPLVPTPSRKFGERPAWLKPKPETTETLSRSSETLEACPYVPGTDPVEYIRADHTEIRGLLSEVARVLPSDPPRARKLLRQARLDIEQHLVSEEDEVFPIWEREHPEYAAELHGFLTEHPGLLADICGLEKRLTLPGLLRFMAKVSDHSQREDRVFGIDVGTRAGYEEPMRSRPRNRPAVKKAHRLGPEVVLLTKRGGAHQNRPRDVATGRAKPKHRKGYGDDS